MKCSKYLAMQFKILHFILVTKEKLLQWGLAQDDICTLPHIFVECEVTKLIWYQWIYQKTHIHFILSTKEILLGTENKNSVIINVLIILAKYYIYKCLQQKEYPTIKNFQNNVKKSLLKKKQLQLQTIN